MFQNHAKIILKKKNHRHFIIHIRLIISAHLTQAYYCKHVVAAAQV